MKEKFNVENLLKLIEEEKENICNSYVPNDERKTYRQGYIDGWKRALGILEFCITVKKQWGE